MFSIDVVVPCYNYARYLEGCVRSITSQEGVAVRVLIIDDCSSDNTETIGRALAAGDPRVEYRRHAENKGHIATYNEGLLGWAAAQAVVLISADDLLAPGSLARAARIFEHDPHVGLVYGRTLHFSNPQELPRRAPDSKVSHTVMAGRKWVVKVCRRGHNVITSPEVVVRTSIHQRVGGYRPELPHAGDLEMWLRIAAISDVAYVSGCQAYYRVHPKSMMRTTFRRKVLDLEQRKAAYDSFFEGLPPAEVPPLRDLAYRAICKDALWDACRAYDRDAVDEVEASGLEAFARATSTRPLPEMDALRRRQRLGAKWCRRTQLFFFPAVMKMIHRWYLRERWERVGT